MKCELDISTCGFESGELILFLLALQQRQNSRFFKSVRMSSVFWCVKVTEKLQQ